MALNKERLKNKLKAAFQKPDVVNNIDQVADEIATAVIEEILALTVTVPAGIKVSTTGTATAQTGATTENKIANLS